MADLETSAAIWALNALEQIADGACGLANEIYELDWWTKDVLAAANALSVAVTDARAAAERRRDAATG
jgi:hypothetical protein